MASVPPRTPVVVGAGQINQHREDPGAEPIDLMVAAARRAADARVLEAVDSIRVVNVLSWRYRDPGLLLGRRLGVADFSTGYSGVGGNVPQTLVNRACLDIQRGRVGVVMIAGAETWRTRTKLRARGSKPDWTRQDDAVPPAANGDDVPMAGPAEQRIELVRPAHVYPLFEQAVAPRRGARRRSTGAASGSCGRSSARSPRETRTRGADNAWPPSRSGGRVRTTG